MPRAVAEVTSRPACCSSEDRHSCLSLPPSSVFASGGTDILVCLYCAFTRREETRRHEEIAKAALQTAVAAAVWVRQNAISCTILHHCATSGDGDGDWPCHARRLFGCQRAGYPSLRPRCAVEGEPAQRASFSFASGFAPSRLRVSSFFQQIRRETDKNVGPNGREDEETQARMPVPQKIETEYGGRAIPGGETGRNACPTE
jgi:hypothetical protein